MAVSPDDEILAVSGLNWDVRVWLRNSSASSKILYNLHGHFAKVTGAAFSSDSKTLATGSKDKTIILWDMTTGQRLHTLKGHSKTVTNIAFSPDGTTLASASGDSIMLWDLNYLKRKAQPASSFEKAFQLKLDGLNIIPMPLPEPNLYKTQEPPLLPDPNNTFSIGLPRPTLEK